MKVRPVLTITIICALMASGCSSMNPMAKKDNGTVASPTPPVKDPVTVPTQAKLTSPPTIDLPPWYVKAPASTQEFLYLSGTGISNDLSMSRQKALLDAQTQLASKLNGVIDAVIRQQRKDTGGDMSTDYTSAAIRKRILDTSLTGWYLEDTKVLSEDKKYRTFVLIRYPLGDANKLFKQRERQEDRKNDDRDIDKEISNANKPISQAPSTQPVVVTPVPAPAVAESRPVPINQLNLLEVENEEYKKRRAEALQKPGAVVGRITIQ